MQCFKMYHSGLKILKTWNRALGYVTQTVHIYYHNGIRSQKAIHIYGFMVLGFFGLLNHNEELVLHIITQMSPL